MKALIEQHAEELKSQIDELGSMTAGSDEYAETLKAISTLTKDIVDLEKIEVERERNELERQDRLAAQEAENKDRKWKNGIAIGSIALPVVAAVWANVYNWGKQQADIMGSTGGKEAISFLQRFRSK